MLTSMKMNDPQFTFPETAAVVGCSDAWLRTFIQRDKEGRIGTRHRTGRLLFSLRDIMGINLMHRLNAGLRIAPAAVWEILDAAMAAFRNGESEAQSPPGDGVHIAFDGEGRALAWTVEDGVVVTWSDTADASPTFAFLANQGIHIVAPWGALFRPVHEALKIAATWPEAGADD